MLTDERLKEMREAPRPYEAQDISAQRLRVHVAELLDEIDRLKASRYDGPDKAARTVERPNGLTALARHIEQGVVITVLRTEAGDTVTTFKRVKHEE